MSESEQRGRCRQQLEAWYANNRSSVPRYSWMIADAIDRLAADVASIKEKLDAVSPEDVKHFVESEKAWVRFVEEQRDAAVRKRDEARAEVESLRESIGAANRLFGAEQAKVERLRNELEQRQPDGNSPEIQDSSSAVTEPAQDASEEIAELKFWVEKYRVKAEAYGGVVRGCAPALERAGHPVNSRGPDGAFGGIARAVEALIRERNMAWAEVERLRAELAAPPAAPAAGWLTERERHVLSSMLSERPVDSSLHWRDDVLPVFRSILARAGSPPVVVLPTVFARSLLGDELVALQQVKDAMDKAGVKWKEV